MDGRHLRCSDDDREQVAEALRKAAGEGRLSLPTLEERLEATFIAQTYADLAPITSDLPEGSYPVPRLPTAARRTDVVARSVPARRVTRKPKRLSPYLPASRSKRITAIMRHVQRKTPWRVPRYIAITALFGEVTLDFCEATVSHPKVVVDVALVAGQVSLIVPDGVIVHTHDVRYLGARPADVRRSRDLHGGPVYWIQGLVLGGTLTVRTPS